MNKILALFGCIVLTLFIILGCSRMEEPEVQTTSYDSAKDILLSVSGIYKIDSVEEQSMGYRISFMNPTPVHLNKDYPDGIKDVYLAKTDIKDFNDEVRKVSILFKDGKACTLEYAYWLDVRIDRTIVSFDEKCSKEMISFQIADTNPDDIEVVMKGCDNIVSYQIQFDDDHKGGTVILEPVKERYFASDARLNFSNGKKESCFDVKLIREEFKFQDGSVEKTFEFADYERFFELELSRQDTSVFVSVGDDCSSWIQAKVSHINVNGIDGTYISFLIRENTGEHERKGKVTIRKDGNDRVLTVNICQIGYGSDGSFKKGLETFYHALNGQSWVRSDNWCTDSPIFEWYGIRPSLISSKSLFSEEGYVYCGIDDIWTIDLSANNMRGEIPQEFWKACRYFESIRLSSEYLPSSEVPQYVWHERLLYLDLSMSFLKVPLGAYIRNAHNLQKLDLSCCDVSGQIPDAVCDLSSLKSMKMRECGITGPIPQSLGSLNHLEELHLEYNMDMDGCLPEGFYNLSALRSFDISATRIGGQLSSAISNLQCLEEFSITGCEFTGTIPEELGTLKMLSNYDLDGNYFTQIPEFVRYFGFDAAPCKVWVGSAGFPLGVPYHQRNEKDGRPGNYIVKVEDAFSFEEILVDGQPLKRPGYYVDLELCHELPFPVWANIKYGMYTWSRGYIDEMKYPVYPSADDLQYPGDEYYYDGSAWRHPKLQYPAREYVHNGTAWVHDPNCPWDKEYTDSNGR